MIARPLALRPTVRATYRVPCEVRTPYRDQYAVMQNADGRDAAAQPALGPRGHVQLPRLSAAGPAPRAPPV